MNSIQDLHGGLRRHARDLDLMHRLLTDWKRQAVRSRAAVDRQLDEIEAQLVVLEQTITINASPRPAASALPAPARRFEIRSLIQHT
jgi:hypothetical protein